MTVSKRLRFEVLRRDGHRCRYCGAAPTGTVLVVDHVLPVALGGTDTAENLVAACEACNSGKSSIAPDAPLVAAIHDDAIRWAKAVEAVASRRARLDEARYEYEQAFLLTWTEWTRSGQPVPLDATWRADLGKFFDLHLPACDVGRLITVAMSKEHIAPHATYRYFCGCCWRTLDDVNDEARELVARSERRTA